MRVSGRRHRLDHHVIGDLDMDDIAERIVARDLPDNAVPGREVERFGIVRRSPHSDPSLLTLVHDRLPTPLL